MEEKYFKAFKEKRDKQLENLQPEDVIPFDFTPIPTSYSLILRPDQGTYMKLSALQDELKIIDNDQYYYPKDRLHLTLIGGFSSALNEELIVTAIRDSLSKYNPIRFTLGVIASNQYCSSVSALPISFSLHDFREEIRAKVGENGDDYYQHVFYYEYVGWINYLRYLKQPKEALLNALREKKEYSVGEMTPSSISLFKTSSRILHPKETTIIHEFDVYA